MKLHFSYLLRLNFNKHQCIYNNIMFLLPLVQLSVRAVLDTSGLPKTVAVSYIHYSPFSSDSRSVGT